MLKSKSYFLSEWMGDMIQKDYLVADPLAAAAAVADIGRIIRTTPHRDALLTIYETGFPRGMVKTLLSSLRVCGGKDLKIAGISIFAIAEMPSTGQGVRMNLILSEKAEFEIVDIPFLPGEEEGAIEKLRERLSAHPDSKAVEILCSNSGIDMDRFLSRSAEGFGDIVFFGTSTANTLRPPLLLIESGGNQYMPNVAADNSFVFGNGIISDGIAAVIFSGEELFVQSNYALGWHRIGGEMEVSAKRDNNTHEICIDTIGGMKATEIFREYLGVKADQYFSVNICEFPLMVNKNGVSICIIPYAFGDNGEIYCCSSVKDGDRVTLSYASSGEVLGSASRSFDEMEEFAPEALFLVMCGNRVNFLQEDAHIEWDKYKVISSDYALVHGFCELYYRNGAGGILNSAHLAIGFSEGKKEHPRKKYESLPDIHRCHHKGVIPLSDRMSFLMTKMTNELLDFAKKAEASNQAKSAFLSNMSHEIRTPINAILGMDEMILRESNEDNVIGYANDIMSAGNSLLSIVNDVLDFSKIEAGKLSILCVEYEFSSVINDLYTVIRKRALDKGLELKLDIDPSLPSVLYGDEIRLKQVVTNILTNAVKYTETGSVTLTVKRVLREKEAFSDGSECHGNACFRRPVFLYFEVKDTGIGIRDEDKEKLFNAFERVDENRNRTIEGTGLGLNITSRLLDLMDSRLSVESVYGQGSTFYFTIKQGISRDEPVGDIRSRLERVHERKKYVERFTAPKASILVVDDTKMNLDVIKNLLKKTRVSIDTAQSGAEALSMVREKSYDIIFLDHRMPEMDGIECLKRMKELKDNRSASSPVISLTANAISGAREEYLTAGFSDYLTKPVDPVKLDDMLLKYLPKEKVVIRDNEAAAEKEPEAEKKSEDDMTLPKWLIESASLDASKGVVYCGSVKGFISVLQSFYSAIPASADEIEKYYNEGDIENYTVKVHALKSSARIIGASELSEKAALLEKAGDDKDLEKIKEDTPSLLSLYRSYQDSLSPLKGDDSVLPDIPDSVLSDAYRSLLEFAEGMDLSLSRMVLDSVQEYRLPKEDGKHFDEIRAALSRLDWELIKKIIKER